MGKQEFYICVERVDCRESKVLFCIEILHDNIFIQKKKPHFNSINSFTHPHFVETELIHLGIFLSCLFVVLNFV